MQRKERKLLYKNNEIEIFIKISKKGWKNIVCYVNNELFFTQRVFDLYNSTHMNEIFFYIYVLFILKRFGLISSKQTSVLLALLNKIVITE